MPQTLKNSRMTQTNLEIAGSARFFSSLLKLRESSMHHTYGSSSFPNGRSRPLDASSADVAYSEYSWKAAFEHVRRTGKRPKRNLIWFDSQWQTASGEDEALIVKCETASQPVGVWQIV